MNAKEISDATLESVTPADNDLMLIYDTSEGKTGKATIASIANIIEGPLYVKTLSLKKNVRQDETTSTPVSFVDNYIVSESGGYVIKIEINNISAGVAYNLLEVKIDNVSVISISNTSSAGWTNVSDSIFIPLKQGASVDFEGAFSIAGFRYAYRLQKVF